MPEIFQYEGLSLLIQAVGVLVVGGTILYAARTFRLQQSSEERVRLEKTLEHLADLAEYFSTAHKTSASRSGESTGDADLALNTLNRLEHLAIAIKFRVLNESMVRDAVDGVVLQLFDISAEYIRQARKDQSDPNLYLNLEALVRAWKSGELLTSSPDNTGARGPMDDLPDRLNIWRLASMLVFKPSQFAAECERFTAALNSPERLQQLHENRPKSPQAERQTTKLRRSLGVSAVWVAAVVIAGAASGIALNHFVGPAFGWPPRILLYSGIGILLWATLGKGGWSIETVDGTTIPESVDRHIFRVLHLVGSFFLILSGTWQVAAALG